MASRTQKGEEIYEMGTLYLGTRDISRVGLAGDVLSDMICDGEGRGGFETCTRGMYIS